MYGQTNTKLINPGWFLESSARVEFIKNGTDRRSQISSGRQLPILPPPRPRRHAYDDQRWERRTILVSLTVMGLAFPTVGANQSESSIMSLKGVSKTPFLSLWFPCRCAVQTRSRNNRRVTPRDPSGHPSRRLARDRTGNQAPCVPVLNLCAWREMRTAPTRTQELIIVSPASDDSRDSFFLVIVGIIRVIYRSVVHEWTRTVFHTAKECVLFIIKKHSCPSRWAANIGYFFWAFRREISDWKQFYYVIFFFVCLRLPIVTENVSVGQVIMFKAIDIDMYVQVHFARNHTYFTLGRCRVLQLVTQ